MVTVTLLSQRLREVHFVNDLEKSGQIQMQNSFNFHVDYTKDNSRCSAKLYQRAQMKDDPDRLFISAEIIGIFQLEGVVDEETKKDAHIQCYDQLFPFLQSAVSQLASAGGLAGFMLKKNQMNRENILFAKKQNAGENAPAAETQNPEEEPPMTLPIV